MAISSMKTKAISSKLLVGNTYYVDNAFESIQTYNLTGSQASVTFSSIPSTYKHLQIRAIMLGSTSGVDAPYIRYNGDTAANYTFHSLLGEGAAARSQGLINQTSTNIGAFWNGLVGSSPSASIIDVLDYASVDKFKTTRSFTGQDNNSTLGSVGMGSGVWRSTSAINSITIFNSGTTTFSQYSSFALYGIK